MFLVKSGLSMYYEKFIENGFDELEILSEIKADHLNSMGVKPGHQIKLRKCLADNLKNRRTGEGPTCRFDGERVGNNEGSHFGTDENLRPSEGDFNQGTANFGGISNSNGQSWGNLRINGPNESTTDDIETEASIGDDMKYMTTDDGKPVYIPLDDEFDYLSEQPQLKTDKRDSANRQPTSTAVKNETFQTPTASALQKPNKTGHEIITQCDSRSQYCYNCFTAITPTSPLSPQTHDDFPDQIFCTKRCLKIQFLENSTFCTNPICPKPYFIKPTGVLSNANWFCSKDCLFTHTDSPNQESMKKSNYSMRLSRDSCTSLASLSPGLYNSMINEAKRLDGEDKRCCQEELELDGEDLFGDESYATLEVDMSFGGGSDEEVDFEMDLVLVKSMMSK